MVKTAKTKKTKKTNVKRTSARKRVRSAPSPVMGGTRGIGRTVKSNAVHVNGTVAEHEALVING